MTFKSHELVSMDKVNLNEGEISNAKLFQKKFHKSSKVLIFIILGEKCMS